MREEGIIGEESVGKISGNLAECVVVGSEHSHADGVRVKDIVKASADQSGPES